MNAPFLDAGFYTIGDAARLLRARKERLRGWIVGYARTKSPPILKNELGWIGADLAFSFVNLMELRFIQHFAAQGVKVASMRKMASEAAKILQNPHPFATRTVFETDGRKILARVADDEGDERLYDLTTRNWEMLELIRQSLHDDVTFDPADTIVAWTPRPEIPTVLIRPSVARGQPSLADSHIPTRALAEALQSENNDIAAVARWFEIEPDAVRDAVLFEHDLALAT
jgi:uncharacterized protein (DUF433 family)